MPVPGLTHLEATALQVTLAGRPMIVLAAYLPRSCPLIGRNCPPLSAGGLPVLMAGDLNAKHVDWNSSLSTRRVKLLRAYADENSCLIFGPDSPTTNPSVTPDVLDIVITKNLQISVYLTSCSVLSSDNLPLIIDTTCRSSFHRPPDRPDFRRTDWASFHTNFEDLVLRKVGARLAQPHPGAAVSP